MALYFSAAANKDEIRIGDPAVLHVNPGTLELWFKTTNGGSSYCGMAVRPRLYGIFMVSNVPTVYNWGGTGDLAASGTYNDGLWHHIAFSFTYGGYAALYIDGALVDDGTYDPDPVPLTLNFCLGLGTPGSQYWSGTLDEVRIWSIAKTLAQVQNDMYKRVLPQSNLAGYWRLDEGGINLGPSGKTAIDLTDNATHGDDYGTIANGSYVPGAPLTWDVG